MLTNEEIKAYARLRSNDKKYLKAMDELIEYELFGENSEEYEKLEESLNPEHNMLLMYAAGVLLVLFLVLYSMFMMEMPATILNNIVYLLGISAAIAVLLKLTYEGIGFVIASKRYQVLYRLLKRYNRDQIIEAYNRAHPDNQI